MSKHVPTPSTTIGALFHDMRPKPAILRELSKDPLHQANWEMPSYLNFLDKCLQDKDIEGKVCLDVGCGDGRFTEYLLDRGAKSVYCVDSDIKPLRELENYSKKAGFFDKITLLHAGGEALADIPDKSIDVTLGIGVFYYLGELYESGIKEVNKKLKKGGILISSDPVIEGIALRSLIFESIEEMIENFEGKSFKEEAQETEFRFPLLSKVDLLSMYSRCGFVLEKIGGLSIFHQLIRIFFVRGIISNEQLTSNLSSLHSIFSSLEEEGTYYKTFLFKHLKK